MSNFAKHIFSDKKAVAEAFAGHLQKEIEKKDKYYLALSGGSTPKVLFDHLAQNYKDSIDWKKVYLFWGDERCVPPIDDESNYKMTKEHLLDFIDIPVENVFRVFGENFPDNEAKRYAAEALSTVPQIEEMPIFDMVMLGMGEDGHTASIFPHQMELLMAKEKCAVATHPVSGQKRVTLTGPVINHAREIAFLVTGAGKKEKVNAIFNQLPSYLDYPASHIHPVNGQLGWWMDEAAHTS